MTFPNLQLSVTSHPWRGLNLHFPALIICYCLGFATASLAQNEWHSSGSTLISKTSNGYLKNGQWKLAAQTEWTAAQDLAIGTDIPAFFAGAENVYIRSLVWSQGQHHLGLGLDAVRMSQETLFWGAQRKNFSELDILGFHPRLIYTIRLSDRLLLHHSWETGEGRGKVALNDEGKRRLFHSKYPNADYEQRDADGRPLPKAGESWKRNASLTHRSVLLQSLLGLAQERFEVTSEVQRNPIETLILSAHIAKFELAELQAQRFGLQVSQQWRSESFGFRLGVGVLYQILNGRDLDDEKIDDSRFLPTGDFDVFFLL